MATADSMRVRLHVPGVKVLEVLEDTPSALVVAVVNRPGFVGGS